MSQTKELSPTRQIKAALLESPPINLQPWNRELILYPQNYDGRTTEPLHGSLWHLPVKLSETGPTVIERAYVVDLVEPAKRKRGVTIVSALGGVSEATVNAGVIGQIRDAIGRQSGSNEMLPKINRIIGISHPEGSVRDRKVLDNKTFGTSAEIVDRALTTPELDLTVDDLILVGQSEGGALMIEFAARLGERCKALILFDPARTSEHPQMVRNIFRGMLYDTYARARKNGKSWRAALREIMEEVLLAWTTPDGTPTPFGFVMSLVTGSWYQRDIARAHGIANRGGASPVNIGLLASDSTRKARDTISADVIVVPAMYARGVNLSIARLGITQAQLSEFFKHDINELDQRSLLRILKREFEQRMFTHAKSVEVVPDWDISHSGSLRKPQIWDAVVDKILLTREIALQLKLRALSSEVH